MKLYDEVIEKVLSLSYEACESASNQMSAEWPKVSDRSMILRSDMAYELGADLQYGIGFSMITESSELVAGDKVRLLGPDLKDIKKDNPYARVSIIRIKPDALGSGETLYNAIRKLEYSRYHFYPDGFMMRVSSSKQKESVRVGKDALKKGLSLGITGQIFGELLKENPAVMAVETIYITDPSFDYERLDALAKEAEGITKTIDHIFKNVVMDCKACNLQEICDEVEGLKELHFKQQNANI